MTDQIEAQPGTQYEGAGSANEEGRRRGKKLTWDEFKTNTKAAFEPDNMKHALGDFGDKTKAAFTKLGEKMGIQPKERSAHGTRGYEDANADLPAGYDLETETFVAEQMTKADKDRVFMRGYTEEDLKDVIKAKEILKLLDRKRK